MRVSERDREGAMHNEVPPHFGGILMVHVLKSPLRRAHCSREPTHTQTALASQDTAQYQMVQCFPYGIDKH